MASTLTLWFLAITLEAVPLVRALRSGFLGRYKFFYSYLAFVLLRDVCLLGVYFLLPKLYAWSYWSSEILAVLLGCGLVWEVYKVALTHFAGAARVARSLLPLLFVFTMARILVEAWNSPNWIPGRTPLQTERDLRIVQAALLLGLAAILVYYAIPVGRNLKGIIAGYGLYLATNLANLILRDHFGDRFQHAWGYIQPVCYLLSTLIWCWSLWSYAPVPETKSRRDGEVDQEGVTKKIRLARARLIRDMRS